MNDIQRQRLRTLADYLETEIPKKPPGSFRMGFWKKGGTSCGTAGCAAGWATEIPEFVAAGFTAMKRIGWDDEGSSFDVVLRVGDLLLEEYEACLEFFGTSDPFDPGLYEDEERDDDGEIRVESVITELRFRADIAD